MNNSTANNNNSDHSGNNENQDLTNKEHKIYSNTQNIGQVS